MHGCYYEKVSEHDSIQSALNSIGGKTHKWIDEHIYV